MKITDELVELHRVLRSQGTRKTTAAGNDLFQQDEYVIDVYLLDIGIVKLMRVAPTGRDMVIELCHGRHLLGATSILSRSPSPVTATSLTYCSFYCVSAARFSNLIDGAPAARFLTAVTAIFNRPES